MDRRTLLASLVAGTAALAGCGGRAPDLDLDLGLGRTDGGGAGDVGGTVDGAGTATPTRSVALPYRGGDGDAVAEPHGVVVENDSGRERYVTAVVTTAAGAELLVASRTVGDEATERFPGLVATAGTYDVVVETADGERVERAWRVDEARGDLRVRLDREPSALTVARCDPECPPLSTGGDRLTYDAGSARGTFYVENRRDATLPVTVELASAYRRVLRYEYDVPPAVRVAVPAVGWGEPEYRATVVADGTTATERWRRADGDRMYAVVDDGTRFLCDTHVRDLRVTNRTDRRRDLSVTVRGDGEPTFESRFDVPASSRLRRRNVVPPASRYGFALSTADGESRSFQWDICPSRGAIEVVLGDGGLWVGVRSMR
jgi:hypothetical protein